MSKAKLNILMPLKSTARTMNNMKKVQPEKNGT